MGKDTCVVCGNKLGWRGGYTLDVDYPEVMICSKCYDHKEIVSDPNTSEGFYSTSMKKFLNAFNAEGRSDEEKECLNTFIEKVKRNRQEGKDEDTVEDERPISSKMVYCPQCKRIKMAEPGSNCFCGGRHIDTGIDATKWTFMSEDEKAALETEFESKYKMDESGIVFCIKGARGRSITVYKDRCVINTSITVGSVLTGNVTDGEKTIFFCDCIGVQYKASGLLIGYLQVETAAATMNNVKDNFFNENTFTFATTSNEDEIMYYVYEYIRNRVAFYKKKNAVISKADEIRKFNDLLKDNIISKEEFEKAKNSLLE